MATWRSKLREFLVAHAGPPPRGNAERPAWARAFHAVLERAHRSEGRPGRAPVADPDRGVRTRPGLQRPPRPRPRPPGPRPGPAASVNRLVKAEFDQYLHEVALRVLGPDAVLGSRATSAPERGRRTYGYGRWTAGRRGGGARCPVRRHGGRGRPGRRARAGGRGLGDRLLRADPRRDGLHLGASRAPLPAPGQGRRVPDRAPRPAARPSCKITTLTI